MIRPDKRGAIVAVVLALVLLQVAAAVMARLSRSWTREVVDKQEQRLQFLRDRLDGVDVQPRVEVVAPTEQRWQLRHAAEVVTTLQVLQVLGDEAGVTFASEKALRSSEVGKQPFVVTGRATPAQLCRFLAAIEEHDHLMVVETGRILPGSEVQVAFELGIATYHTGGAR